MEIHTAANQRSAFSVYVTLSLNINNVIGQNKYENIAKIPTRNEE